MSKSLEAFVAGGTTNITTNPQVKNVIDRLSLYQEVGELAPLPSRISIYPAQTSE
jgi:hypothetical protein